MATTIFMTARIAPDRVPDAFAFFVRQAVWPRHLKNPCPPVLLWRGTSLTMHCIAMSVTFSETSAVVGTFGSWGWIGFLRTMCSKFQLLSLKCKVLSQNHALVKQLWCWVGPDGLCQHRELVRSHFRPPQLVWIICCFVPTFCPPESFVFSWPFLASQQSLIFSSRDHRVRPQSLTNLFIVHCTNL